jgi:lipopolysaccharide biosynthesis glycosyltransferase
MNSILTIVTSDYIHYALALRESIFEFEENLDFIIFISDNDLNLKELVEDTFERTVVKTPADFIQKPLANSLFEKYHEIDMDAYRWSMKSVLMSSLLEEKYTKCLYFDCDIHVYSSLNFLFDLLDENRILLSPHNRSLYPSEDTENFKKNLTEGIYNGGFVGASKQGIPALIWWAEACLYKCERNFEKGLYVDQKYLEIMPARF